MAKRFEGIYPPTITSFTDNGDIYEEGIRHVIRYLMSRRRSRFFHQRFLWQLCSDDQQ